MYPEQFSSRTSFTFEDDFLDIADSVTKDTADLTVGGVQKLVPVCETRPRTEQFSETRPRTEQFRQHSDIIIKVHGFLLRIPLSPVNYNTKNLLHNVLMHVDTPGLKNKMIVFYRACSRIHFVVFCRVEESEVELP